MINRHGNMIDEGIERARDMTAWGEHRGDQANQSMKGNRLNEHEPKNCKYKWIIALLVCIKKDFQSVVDQFWSSG